MSRYMYCHHCQTMGSQLRIEGSTYKCVNPKCGRTIVLAAARPDILSSARRRTIPKETH